MCLLDRFEESQSHSWDSVKSELYSGKKWTHWMWFMFPQHVGLAKSNRSIFYGVTSQEEALTYSAHVVLGSRLRECCNILLSHENKTAVEIFGDVDAEKLRSCLTLFMIADPSQTVYKNTLYKYFDLPDKHTIELLNS